MQDYCKRFPATYRRITEGEDCKITCIVDQQQRIRGFLTITNTSVALDEEKIKADAKYDGIWDADHQHEAQGAGSINGNG
jgi:hypothetical protein